MQIDDKKIEVTSRQFWLNYKDFLKGLLVAFGTGAFMVAEPAINAGTFDAVNWRVAIGAGISAGVVYLAKNFLQPAQVKADVTNKEAAEIVKHKSPDTASK